VKYAIISMLGIAVIAHPVNAQERGPQDRSAWSARLAVADMERKDEFGHKKIYAGRRITLDTNALAASELTNVRTASLTAAPTISDWRELAERAGASLVTPKDAITCEHESWGCTDNFARVQIGAATVKGDSAFVPVAMTWSVGTAPYASISRAVHVVTLLRRGTTWVPIVETDVLEGSPLKGRAIRSWANE
jgi:hypothetical protein